MDNVIFLYLVISITVIIVFTYVWTKNKNKFSKVLLSFLLIIFVIVPPTWFVMQFIPEHVSEASMIKSYTNNKEIFKTVAQYMVSYGEDTHIVKYDGSYKIGYFSDVFNSEAKDISDEKVENDIEYILHNLKYKFIYYSGGYVSFTRTCDSNARNQKLVYVINDDILKKKEVYDLKLIEDKWYYFWGRK